MTSKINAARVAVKAAACLDTSSDTAGLDTSRADTIQTTADHEAPAVNIHAVFDQFVTCGYDRDLLLRAHDVQLITSRLRGLSALSALFIAAGDSDAFTLGEWMEGGLHNSMHALVTDVENALSHCNAKARKGGAA